MRIFILLNCNQSGIGGGGGGGSSSIRSSNLLYNIPPLSVQHSYVDRDT